MSAPTYTSDPAREERIGDGSGFTPDTLLICFEPGVVTPSVRASDLGIDTWNGFQGGPPVATVALRVDGRPMALHIGQSAADLRKLADACLRAAAALEEPLS